MKKYLNRRIWDVELGLCYFCTICGTYKPEKEFYKSKRTAWGKDTRCKLHFKNREKDDSKNDHLKLSKVKEEDFAGAKQLLQLLGYDTSDPNNPIHQQVINKYKLNKNNEL